MYLKGLQGCSECAMDGLTPPRRYEGSMYRVRNGLFGLRGIDPFGLVNAALALTRPGSSTGIEGAATPNVAVTTNAQTQISPQISPVFVQQEKPQDSAVGVATMQTAPSNQITGAAGGTPVGQTPVTGAIPGIDTASGYLPTGTAMIPTSSGGVSSGTALTAGAALLGLALILRGGRKKPMKGRK